MQPYNNSTQVNNHLHYQATDEVTHIKGFNKIILQDDSQNVGNNSTGKLSYNLNQIKPGQKIRNIWLSFTYSVSAADLFLDTEYIGANCIDSYTIYQDGKKIISITSPETLDALVGSCESEQFFEMTKGKTTGISNNTQYRAFVPLILPWVNPSNYNYVPMFGNNLSLDINLKYVTYAHNDGSTNPTATDGVDSNSCSLFYEIMDFGNPFKDSMTIKYNEYNTYKHIESFAAEASATSKQTLHFGITPDNTSAFYFFIQYRGETSNTESDIYLLNLLDQIDTVSFRIGNHSIFNVTSVEFIDFMLKNNHSLTMHNIENEDNLVWQIPLNELKKEFINKNIIGSYIPFEECPKNVFIEFTLTLKDTADVVESYNFVLIQETLHVYRIDQHEFNEIDF